MDSLPVELIYYIYNLLFPRIDYIIFSLTSCRIYSCIDRNKARWMKRISLVNKDIPKRIYHYGNSDVARVLFNKEEKDRRMLSYTWQREIGKRLDRHNRLMVINPKLHPSFFVIEDHVLPYKVLRKGLVTISVVKKGTYLWQLGGCVEHNFVLLADFPLMNYFEENS